MTTIRQLVDTLHARQCSLVVATTDGRIIIGRQRGVKDLYAMLTDTPDLLHGALVADKVVGKGAAALMALGQIARLHADTLSRPAADLLTRHGIPFSCDTLVDNIINRAGTGICPVEALTASAPDAPTCLPLIARFLASLPTTVLLDT